jgi:hypothetical protein
MSRCHEDPFVGEALDRWNRPTEPLRILLGKIEEEVAVDEDGFSARRESRP